MKTPKKPKKNRIKIQIRTKDGASFDINLDDATDEECQTAYNIGLGGKVSAATK